MGSADACVQAGTQKSTELLFRIGFEVPLGNKACPERLSDGEKKMLSESEASAEPPTVLPGQFESSQLYVEALYQVCLQRL